jgi:hypothetical protein
MQTQPPDAASRRQAFRHPLRGQQPHLRRRPAHARWHACTPATWAFSHATRAEGIQATIEETTTGPLGIAALLAVEWPEPATARSDRVSFSQAYIVSDGLVTEIHSHDDRDSALAAISN